MAAFTGRLAYQRSPQSSPWAPAYRDDVTDCLTPTASTGPFLLAAVIRDLSQRPEACCPMDVNTRPLFGYSDGQKERRDDAGVVSDTEFTGGK